MTALLVSVRSAAEAETALKAGAGFIDAKDPDTGALGALPAETVAAIVQAVGEAATVTAAAGDRLDAAVAEGLAEAGAAIVKVCVPEGDDAAAALAAVGDRLAGRTRLVAVFAADRDPDDALIAAAKAAGFAGVMLDTAAKGKSLLEIMDRADIARFVAEAHRNRLMVGLAGSLRLVDIGTLMPFNPDLIGFRGAVCEDGIRTRPLDPARVRAAATALAVHGVRRATGG